MRIFRKIENLSDEELMLLVYRGEKEAFNQIYKRYYERILNYFFRMLNYDEEKSRDFAQDLFIKIIEKSELFDSTRKLKPWIYTIASNMCKNEYRRMKVRQDTKNDIDSNDLASDEDLLNVLNKDEFKVRLASEISKLDVVNKSIFIQRYYEDLSIKEIAEMANCPEGTVKSRLFYTLKKLSVSMNEFDPRG